MKWLRWTEGRQKSGYKKMLLLRPPLPLPFDLWLLKYPEGSEIGWHRDEVENEEGKKTRRHYRLNMVLKESTGGPFESEDPPLWKSRENRIVWFRPDINKHRVKKISKGTRYVLSLGWLKND